METLYWNQILKNMIIKTFDDESLWKQERIGKITGTRLKDIIVLRGTEEKKGFYELIAERLAVPRPEHENVMARGHELEKQAVYLLEGDLGIKFNTDLVIWERKDENSIAISPDAYTEDLKTAVEVKCLNSADHIKAVITNKWPKEYENQVYQYFIVNDKLETLYFVMFDPSLSVHWYKCFTINREDIQEQITNLLEFEKKKLDEINKIVSQLSF